ncbi:MAG: hypothetical protein SGCHY_004911 [Lobulomycetales sp.]
MRFTLHKVKVQALAFSPNEKYLSSLGGPDDNSVIVWDLEKGEALCGSPASKDSSGGSLALSYFSNDDNSFVTGGQGILRVWELHKEQRKVLATDCQTGQIKRVVKCITIDENDEYMYCGTTTGDLLQDYFSMGILSVTLHPKNQSIIVGSGDGTIATLALPQLNILSTAKVAGSVTSITFDDDKSFWVGTSKSNMYLVNPGTEPQLKNTCHYSSINDIAFPEHSGDIFATASDTDVRIWNLKTSQEMLRVEVPNLECKCVIFKKEGSSMITGWTDGKIRAFGPQSGRLQYQINDAHKKCVTALAVTDPYNEHGDINVISGGEDGEVRVWKISKHIQVLEHAMKEHKGTVTCIKLRKNNLECVSSSSDGSCIIWDLTRCVRNQVLFAPSFFKAVAYFPDESQLLTSGTDRKVAYWEAFDGSLIRELDASQSDSINGLDITSDGQFFVIGGSDKLVKVWDAF